MNLPAVWDLVSVAHPFSRSLVHDALEVDASRMEQELVLSA